MSTETVILVTLREVCARLARIERRLDQVQAEGGRPDRLKTGGACQYAGCAPSTLVRWHAAGLLTKAKGPRPWSRAELDTILDGLATTSGEGRGRRRHSGRVDPDT